MGIRSYLYEVRIQLVKITFVKLLSCKQDKWYSHEKEQNTLFKWNFRIVEPIQCHLIPLIQKRYWPSVRQYWISQNCLTSWLFSHFTVFQKLIVVRWLVYISTWECSSSRLLFLSANDYFIDEESRKKCLKSKIFVPSYDFHQFTRDIDCLFLLDLISN